MCPHPSSLLCFCVSDYRSGGVGVSWGRWRWARWTGDGAAHGPTGDAHHSEAKGGGHYTRQEEREGKAYKKRAGMHIGRRGMEGRGHGIDRKEGKAIYQKRLLSSGANLSVGASSSVGRALQTHTQNTYKQQHRHQVQEAWVMHTRS